MCLTLFKVFVFERAATESFSTVTIFYDHNTQYHLSVVFFLNAEVVPTYKSTISFKITF